MATACATGVRVDIAPVTDPPLLKEIRANRAEVLSILGQGRGDFRIKECMIDPLLYAIREAIHSGRCQRNIFTYKI